MLKILILFFYNFGMILFLPIFFLVYFFTNLFISKLPLNILLQRFGLGLPFHNHHNKKSVWIHSVSSGEVNAITKLIDCLIKDGGYIVYLSTATPSGYKTANRLVMNNLYLFYFPLDYKIIMKSLIKKIKPQMLILVELELWPNMLIEAKMAAVDIFVVNGRMENIPYRNYLKLKAVMSPLLGYIKAFCLQNEEHKSRFIGIGASFDKIYITGNTKFDYSPPCFDYNNRDGLREFLGINSKDIIILFVSTHQGEEPILIDIFSKLTEVNKNIKLMIAPRDVARRKTISNYIIKKGMSFNLRSKCEIYDKDIYIIDTIGELANFFYISDIVVMGGSFSKKVGGHNILEPAYFNKPIMVGEYNYTIQDIFLEFKKNDAIKVTNIQNIFVAILEIINSSGKIKRMVDSAKYLLNKGKGASNKTYEIIMELSK